MSELQKLYAQKDLEFSLTKPVFTDLLKGWDAAVTDDLVEKVFGLFCDDKQSGVSVLDIITGMAAISKGSAREKVDGAFHATRETVTLWPPPHMIAPPHINAQAATPRSCALALSRPLHTPYPLRHTPSTPK